MFIKELSLPVKNIFCIGRNYSEHAKELGNEIPSAPIVFLKPLSSLRLNPTSFEFPNGIQGAEPEVEVVLAMGKDKILGMAIGFDWTDRKAQNEIKKKGLPWTFAKGLPGFASVGPFVPFKNPVEFSLQINEVTKQTGNTSHMLFSIERLIPFLKTHLNFGEGDLLFTGTPHGVTEAKSGDRLRASIHGSESAIEISVK